MLSKCLVNDNCHQLTLKSSACRRLFVWQNNLFLLLVSTNLAFVSCGPRFYVHGNLIKYSTSVLSPKYNIGGVLTASATTKCPYYVRDYANVEVDFEKTSFVSFTEL